MAFPETSAALRELGATTTYGLGAHLHPAVSVGVPGLTLGDIQFNPAKHDFLDVNHFSLLGEATGELHVTEVLPDRPLNVNVVTDLGSIWDARVITRRKQEAARAIAAGIATALPSLTDRTTMYAVGQSPTHPAHSSETKLVSLDVVEGGRAESVASLAPEGPLIVLSDFIHMPLEEHVSGDVSRNVLAVKVNHPFERRIPANIGVLALNRGYDLDTSNKRKLARANSRLDDRHLGVMARLQDAGISVVDVILDPKLPEGFDQGYVDNRLAEGIKMLTLK